MNKRILEIHMHELEGMQVMGLSIKIMMSKNNQNKL